MSILYIYKTVPGTFSEIQADTVTKHSITQFSSPFNVCYVCWQRSVRLFYNTSSFFDIYTYIRLFKNKHMNVIYLFTDSELVIISSQDNWSATLFLQFYNAVSYTHLLVFVLISICSGISLFCVLCLYICKFSQMFIMAVSYTHLIILILY